MSVGITDLPPEIFTLVTKQMSPEHEQSIRLVIRGKVLAWLNQGPPPRDCVRSKVSVRGLNRLECDLTVWSAANQWVSSCRRTAFEMSLDLTQIPALLYRAAHELSVLLQTWPSGHVPPNLKLLRARAALLQSGDNWMVTPKVFVGYRDKTALEVQLTILGEYTADMRRVNIMPGVTRIDGSAFTGCRELREVIVPTGVTSIGMNAFSGCERLKQVTLPQSVTRIGSFAFYNCRDLREIIIPQGVLEISTGTFYGCRGLRQIAIPNSVTRIGTSAFYMCKTLRNVLLPDGITAIDACAFLMCLELREIVIPEGVTEIANHTFQDCGKLQRVHMHTRITQIRAGAFIGCKELHTACIPENVTTIGTHAFAQCAKLRRLHMPKDVRVGAKAFLGCHELEIISHATSPL